MQAGRPRVQYATVPLRQKEKLEFRDGGKTPERVTSLGSPAAERRKNLPPLCGSFPAIDETTAFSRGYNLSPLRGWRIQVAVSYGGHHLVDKSLRSTR